MCVRVGHGAANLETIQTNEIIRRILAEESHKLAHDLIIFISDGDTTSKHNSHVINGLVHFHSRLAVHPETRSKLVLEANPTIHEHGFHRRRLWFRFQYR